MKFENSPQLILTKDEFETFNKALKLCQDMDNMTGKNSCEICPIKGDCVGIWTGCIYLKAHSALKKIIDIAIVK